MNLLADDITVYTNCLQKIYKDGSSLPVQLLGLGTFTAWVFLWSGN